LAWREEQTNEYYQTAQNESVNQTHYQRILDLQRLAEDKGYHLVFILYPKLPPSKYLELIPIFELIDTRSKIDLGNPQLYPELYQIDYSFDAGHMNEAGSIIFTIKLANGFNRVIGNIAN